MRAKSEPASVATRAWIERRFSVVVLAAALGWLGYVVVTTVLG